MVYGSPPDWIDNLHKFGELAIVHDGAHSISSKLQDKGLLCLFVGYPEIHAGEVCQFFNLATKRIILSRSAILLKINFHMFNQLTMVLQMVMFYQIPTNQLHIMMLMKTI
jgi:hypothetical protein